MIRSRLVRSSHAFAGLALGLARLDAAEPAAVPPLSPEESLATIRVPEGYRLELVASEPLVEEPVALAWDGDGRLYVAEMRTYMQDIDGRDQHRPTSRVSLLEDDDGDGRMDRRVTFADRLVLPRMILPLDEGVVIRETDTLDLWLYHDRDGDGRADEKTLWHEGGRRGGNLEHQPSGLVWNIDNWIYTTYSRHRYRVRRGRVERSPLPHGSGQWGLGQDDVGRLYYSTAGGERAAMDFQAPIIYGQIRLPGELARGFQEVYPLVEIPDVQGGRGRVRGNDTLNHFTGCAGQSVYRGDRLPEDLRGDLIIPEPVGRLIRRARITRENGKTVLSKVYDRSEFIASTDPNFRPLNSATGPDGCLYIVDMYRGIIQEGNWVRPGSYLRGVVEAYGLQKNVGRGRIYRLVHEAFEPGPRPRLRSASNAELCGALSHPNGWWRDNAQRLLVLRAERSAVPEVERVLASSASALGRLHALWTLEGLEALSAESLARATRDTDPRVRAAAIRVSEPLIASGEAAAEERLRAGAEDADIEVALQALLSAQYCEYEGIEELTSRVVERFPASDAVLGIDRSFRSRLAALRAERERREELAKANERMARSYAHGRVIYETLCVTCHGLDGKGTLAPEGEERIAPPLAGSARVLGEPDRLLRILLHGLTGPVEGKTYRELMVPMGGNDDTWISSVLNYARNSFGNRGGYISPDETARVRKLSRDRGSAWTLAELHAFDPYLGNRGEWKLSASHGDGGVRRAIDGHRGSRWETGTAQVPGMWFQVEFPEPERITECRLDAAASARDFPTACVVEVSDDGKAWRKVAEEVGTEPVFRVSFDPIEARYVRFTQTGAKPGLFWSIHDLEIAGAPEAVDSSASEAPTGPTLEELLAKRGQAERGAAVFVKNCSTCHRVGELGVRFGPDLSEVGSRLERRAIVESILTPAAKIEEPFRGYMIQTRQGEFLAGFIAAESDDAITLLQQAGVTREIRTRDILLRQAEEGTFMPAGLERAMPLEDLLDLIEWLAARKKTAG